MIIPEFFGYPLQLECKHEDGYDPNVDKIQESNIPEKCKHLTLPHVKDLVSELVAESCLMRREDNSFNLSGCFLVMTK